MESDSELLEDEEEILVYVEFEGFVNNNIFTDKQLQLDMVGIDTDHPIMQIDGRFYEGTYEDVVGTYMFFEKDDKPVVDDPVFDQVPTLKYFGKTRKLLKMQRVFVKQRTEVLGDSEHSKCIPNMETIKEAGVPPKYQSQALSFWKDIRDNRIDALCAYLEKQRIKEEKRSQGIAVDSESDEDNPFAIYKYKEEQKYEKTLENDNNDLAMDELKSSVNESESKKESSQEITEDNVNVFQYIDPKPSTSKNSDPCTDIINVKERKPTVKVIRKKTKRAITQLSTKKRNRKQKLVGDKTVRNSDDGNIESSPLMLNNVPEDSVIKIELDDMANTPEATCSAVDTIDITEDSDKQMSTDEVETKTDNNPTDNSVDKRHQKLLKREAKMKEISERLKSVAEEYLKANMNQ